MALLGAQSQLNIAVLIDFQKVNQQSIENLYKSKLLKQRQVLTFAEYALGNEADIEDMFDPGFYLNLVNSEFGSNIQMHELPETHPRILRRIQAHIDEQPLPNKAKFNHYRPARLFTTSIENFEADLSDETLDRFQSAFDALNELLD